MIATLFILNKTDLLKNATIVDEMIACVGLFVFYVCIAAKN